MDVAIIESIKSDMVLVKGGTFMMGDLLDMYRPCLFSPKIIKVKVTLSDFHICNHTVTQAEYEAVMNGHPLNANRQLPAAGVSWHKAQEFMENLNRMTGMEFRLPTEAEWEYAARGGELSNGSIYSGNNILDTVGWYRANSDDIPHPVCQKKANQLGLFDMSGNVWEWCQDIYEKHYRLGKRKWIFPFKRLPVENPQGGIVGDFRVTRGGSYRTKEKKCWVFYRDYRVPSDSSSDLGFRLAY